MVSLATKVLLAFPKLIKFRSLTTYYQHKTDVTVKGKKKYLLRSSSRYTLHINLRQGY